jgi:hypothetical protein
VFNLIFGRDEMRKSGIRLGPSIVVALSLALLSMLAMAGSSSTTLPNGAALTVSIDDPVTSTEFEVPPGQPSIDVPVHGTASVVLGEPDATFVYVMDISGSTDGGSGTGCSPILDCEKKFLKALNQAVILSGSADEVGLAVFATSAATGDMSPAGGDQLIVAPDAPGAAPSTSTPWSTLPSVCRPAMEEWGSSRSRTSDSRRTAPAGSKRP